EALPFLLDNTHHYILQIADPNFLTHGILTIRKQSIGNLVANHGNVSCRRYFFSRRKTSTVEVDGKQSGVAECSTYQSDLSQAIIAAFNHHVSAGGKNGYPRAVFEIRL